MSTPRKIATMPEIALIAITRVTLGVGLGLLLARKLGEARRTMGWTLLLIGLATTVPLAMEVMGGRDCEADGECV